MEVSPKEMRKMLNAAWGKGVYTKRRPVFKWLGKAHMSQRYRDVSRILEAKKKEQRKDGRDD